MASDPQVGYVGPQAALSESANRITGRRAMGPWRGPFAGVGQIAVTPCAMFVDDRGRVHTELLVPELVPTIARETRESRPRERGAPAQTRSAPPSPQHNTARKAAQHGALFSFAEERKKARARLFTATTKYQLVLPRLLLRGKQAERGCTNCAHYLIRL